MGLGMALFLGQSFMLTSLDGSKDNDVPKMLSQEPGSHWVARRDH